MSLATAERCRRLASYRNLVVVSIEIVASRLKIDTNFALAGDGHGRFVPKISALIYNVRSNMRVLSRHQSRRVIRLNKPYTWPGAGLVIPFRLVMQSPPFAFRAVNLALGTEETAYFCRSATIYTSAPSLPKHPLLAL